MAPGWSQSPASLDSIYSVLSGHDHPFVIVGCYALKWMGVQVEPGYTLDILIRTTQKESICQTFVETGEWLETDEQSKPLDLRYYTEERRSFQGFKRYNEKWYINLCDEGSYRLTVDSPKIQVPHVLNYNSVLMESEFHPNAKDRSVQVRVRPFLITDEDILFVGDEPITFPVFIPTIPQFLDSCLDCIGGGTDVTPFALPEMYMDDLARYLILDAPSQQEKFLAKVRNRERLAEYFTQRQRKQERRMERVLQRRAKYKVDSTSEPEVRLPIVPLRFEQPQNIYRGL